MEVHGNARFDRRRGVFGTPFSVRPAKDGGQDSDKDSGKYEIIDGLYRYTSARDLRLDTIPCIIKHNVSDDAALAAQIQANAIRPETSPVAFAMQMKRMLTRRPEMKFDELAHMIHKSPGWVRQTLGLLRLGAKAKAMLEHGEIPIQSAYMLAKIPSKLQADYLDQARTLSAREFQALGGQCNKAVHRGRQNAERWRPSGVVNSSRRPTFVRSKKFKLN